MLPQRDTPSRWGYITVSPNFTETKKGKQNEKTEEFVSIERTREKMPKKTGEVEIIYQDVKKFHIILEKIKWYKTGENYYG